MYVHHVLIHMSVSVESRGPKFESQWDLPFPLFSTPRLWLFTDTLSDFFMYVCMYVCMYFCMYVCMYVCIYVCMHVCMYGVTFFMQRMYAHTECASRLVVSGRLTYKTPFTHTILITSTLVINHCDYHKTSCDCVSSMICFDACKKICLPARGIICLRSLHRSCNILLSIRLCSSHSLAHVIFYLYYALCSRNARGINSCSSLPGSTRARDYP